MAQEHEKTETTAGGIGLGVDVNITLKQLDNVVDLLSDALRETGSAVSSSIGDAINKIKEMGPQNLKQQAQQGGQEDKYQQMVGMLQQAADRGEEEAGNLLRQMGERVGDAGRKMQEKGQEEESRH